jgi:hypothetical protein
MKIQVLSLEEIEAPQSDAPANATDTGSADTAASAAPAAPAAEPAEPVTQESAAADEAQSEALESQFLVLEDLIQSWKAEGRLTPLMVIQANESLPSLRIAHGHHSHWNCSSASGPTSSRSGRSSPAISKRRRRMRLRVRVRQRLSKKPM